MVGRLFDRGPESHASGPPKGRHRGANPGDRPGVLGLRDLIGSAPSLPFHTRRCDRTGRGKTMIFPPRVWSLSSPARLVIRWPEDRAWWTRWDRWCGEGVERA